MMKAQCSHKGFTLIELLVVIAIMVILLAILVPVGKRLREGNNTNRCEAQLSHLGQALKMYFLDEGGVPPLGVAGHLDAGSAVVDDPTVDFDRWPGLETLFYLDYLRSRKTLHCPRHTEDVAGEPLSSASPEFYRSYMLPDPQATGGAVKQYKYFPARFAGQTGYPDDFRRQLTRNLLQIDEGGTAYLVTGASSSLPPDDTIVTWCNYHAETYSLNGHGQYVALYWDGSVRLLDKELFTDDSVGPAEAWMVRPTDSAH